MKISIYGLYDPETNSIKYVGKTKNELRFRLSSHASCESDNVAKNLWISSLKQKGLKPEIKLLELVDSQLADLKEAEWIQKFTNAGTPLLNKTLDANHQSVILNSYIAQLNRLNYSPQTIKSYRGYFICFLRDFSGQVYTNIQANQIEIYLSELVEIKKISPVHQNSLINAIKFYYEKVLKRPRQTYYISRPKKETKIRPILSPDQILQLMDAIPNLKHKTAMQLIYSGALRIGEVVKILVTQIDFRAGTVLIKAGKGKKDRWVILPRDTIALIEAYLDEYKCDYWLFEGQDKKYHYAPESIRATFDRAVKFCNFNPELTPHCLRHSRTTHVLNNGVKIETASKQLGHSSIAITADTYHHYILDEVREQYDLADAKMKNKHERKRQENQRIQPSLRCLHKANPSKARSCDDL